MSKKTKKQKQTAELRKRKILLKVYSTQTATESAKEPTPPAEQQHNTQNVASAPAFSFFIADLKKSLIIICFILALEIALYFGRIYN